MSNSKRGVSCRVVLALAVITATLVTAAPSSALIGTKRLLVVLCNFQDQSFEPDEPLTFSRDYYRDMFSSQGDGKRGSYDYWEDVSYGKLRLDATVVGWYTIPQQRDEWAALDRTQRWKRCVEMAAADVHYEAFVSAVVVYPEAVTRTSTAIDADDTTVMVTGDLGAAFPSTPFRAKLFDGATSEVVRVTAISGNTFTIERGQPTTPASPAVAHATDSWLQADGGDLFGGAPAEVDIKGAKFTLGEAFGPHDLSLTGFMHETAHSLGLPDGTSLSASPGYYNDCWDTMSVYSCVYAFDETDPAAQFGGSTYYKRAGRFFTKGPGLNSINLDTMGWLSADRKTTFDNSSCRQETYTMAALNHVEASGYLQLRYPIGQPLFDYFTVELRNKDGWDRGAPANAFLIHAKVSDDGRSLLLDQYADGTAIGGTSGSGALIAGSTIVLTNAGMYLGVNSIHATDHVGRVTLGSCKIRTQLEYVGATRGQLTDVAVLSADLKVEGSGAPIPKSNVRLALGSESCTAETDQAGHARCGLDLDGPIGDRPITASFTGNAVYEPSSDSATFTVEKEVTSLTHAGTLTSDYHDRFVAFGQLTDDDGAPVVGRSVSFSLGAADGCTATTTNAGVASCPITPTQPAGTYLMSTSFSGDPVYQPSSDSDSFEITHEESTTTNTGPTVLLAGTGSTATLKARFVEDGPNGDGTDRTAVPSGQTISFALGSQSCSATTDVNGLAQCSVNVSGSQALGPQPVTATFAGDAYYEPSSDSKDAMVFAFPSTGAFVLGDTTVAGATPTTRVTWWSDAWWSLNNLTGGPAPLAFKGYAATVRQLPTTNPANSCGTSFTSPPGNSPPPPSTVPSYMGVLVSSSAVKSGRGINGQWGQVVVVRTDAGYSPKPGRVGTGTIVATFCH